MNEFISSKSLVISLILSFVILGYISVKNLNPITKIVFCDVGQGDAIYIRVKNRFDILIDAGPDRKILNCLGRHMPFYDKKIELAFISHPQKDHFYGYIYLIDRYQIERFFISPIDNTSLSFQSLKKKINNQKIKTDVIYAGKKINIYDSSLVFLWPSKEFSVNSLIYDKTSNDQPDYKLPILGASSLDSNHFSLVMLYQETNFKALLTGDASSLVLNRLPKWQIIKTNLLKVPHHGSKNGLNEQFLRLADPQVAVISVGENNPYGHPASETLALLQALKTKIRRTDTEGDIVFKIKR